MPNEPLFDLTGIDLNRTVVPIEEIRAAVPHRYEFALLDGIAYFDPVTLNAVGFHDAKDDAFWVRGHIPGDPIFPGALMIECAAQLSSYCYRKRFGKEDGKFFGFGGIDKVKFRQMVRPGERLHVLCKDIRLDRRFSRFAVQGFCGDKFCFEGEIIGVQMTVNKAATAG